MRSVGSVALLTGGGDRPYAHGLAFSLAKAGVRLDFIGSDFLESEALQSLEEVRFLNLRGDMSPEAPPGTKAIRVFRYYVRLLAYSLTSDARIFHVLWNNRFEAFDRTILIGLYRLLGKRVVRTVHNVNAAERDGIDTAFNRFTLKIQYALSHHLFVHTEQMKLQLMGQFGVADSAISVIPFGINDTVPNTGLGNAEARRRLGLAGDHRVLLFFGNIAPYKGVEILVDAFASIARDDPRYRLVIAGRPKGEEVYWAEVKRSIFSLGIADKVITRIEYIPDEDTEVYFKAADVLVLPCAPRMCSRVAYCFSGTISACRSSPRTWVHCEKTSSRDERASCAGRGMHIPSRRRFDSIFPARSGNGAMKPGRTSSATPMRSTHGRRLPRPRSEFI